MPRVLSLLGLLVLGCKPSTDTNPPGTDDSQANGQGESAVEQPSGEKVVFASVGVPHVAAITLIAIDPSGKAALTRDTAGGVRLWPALDGSREPLIVPIRDPRMMALGQRGEGWTLALLDAAGGARIVAVDASGKMEPLASLPPTDPLAEIVVLPGGERLVAVGSDHVIRLLDRKGSELARLDSPGLRPASLRVAMQADEGEARVVALTAGEFDGGQGRFAIELLPLEIGEASIALGSHRRVLHLDSPATVDNPTLAPDGRSVVYLQRQRLGSATWKVHAMQLEDGLEISVDSEIPNGQQPRFGLMSGGRVLVDDGTGMGRVVDLRERNVELIGLRSSPTLNHLAATYSAGLRVAPANNWLAVHQLERDDLIYLGYEQINVTDVGLSPSGKSVAWALGDRVAVEAVGSNVVFEVPGTRPHAQRFVNFLDEELLLTLDWNGGAKLLRWHDGEVVAAVDLANSTQMSELARDGQGNGVMFVRTNLWQNPTVVELRERQFGARYLTYASANLAGILAPADAPLEDWGAWTLDGAGKLRSFTLGQLRDGVDTKAALEGGELLSFGLPEQFAVDSRGNQYWVRTTGSRPTLHVERGTKGDELELAPGFLVRLTPSPDGRRIAVVQQREINQVLTVIDAETLQPLWAQPLPPVNGLAWSDASERVGVPASFGGGVVFDADNGSTEATRCGLAFEVRRTPPMNVGFFTALNVCDL
ncbi:MAG TPA: hypothetical protein VM869_21480 [Enhygromyxa sp.]|nr:hypothetical protein [Enhygromyxa sp.]